MEDKAEGTPRQFPLPRVSKETLREAASFGENELVTARDSNSPLFRHLLSRNLQEFMGGFLVDRILQAEAEKQKKIIPEIKEETIDEYEDTKIKELDSLRKRAGIEQEPTTLAEMLDAYRKIEELQKREGPPPSDSFAKYKTENSELMDYLALDLARTLGEHGYLAPEIAAFQNGAFRTYELIRLQTEKG